MLLSDCREIAFILHLLYIKGQTFHDELTICNVHKVIKLNDMYTGSVTNAGSKFFNVNLY